MEWSSGVILHESQDLSARLNAAATTSIQIEKKTAIANSNAKKATAIPQKSAKTVAAKPKTVSKQKTEPLPIKVETQSPQNTTTPAPAPTPAEAKPDFITEVEQQIFILQNAERVKNGLPTLLPDATLAAVARAHSVDMAAKNYFNHTDLSGCSSACRVDNAGYAWRAVGENIYMMSGYQLPADATAQKMVEGWMNSPGHRANILGSAFTNAGVGVAEIGDSIYATVDLAQPR